MLMREKIYDAGDGRLENQLGVVYNARRPELH